MLDDTIKNGVMSERARMHLVIIFLLFSKIGANRLQVALLVALIFIK
jgi:hypothetical protein